MSEAVVRFGKDTWVASGKPNVNHNGASRIKVKSGEAYGYVHMKNPVPHGLTVVTATLTFYVATATDWSGTKTIGVRRAQDRVPFARATWENMADPVGGTVSATVTDPTPHQAIALDVTNHVQKWADGDPNYGWRIETDSTTSHKLWGFDSDYPPVLTVDYALSPVQPVDLSPSGGAVSVQFPVFTFDAVDLENPHDMTALELSIASDPTVDADGAFVTPEFTTATAYPDGVPATSPEWESATSAWTGIDDGALRYWIVRYKSGEGVWGDRSEPVPFSRVAKGTLTIDNPPVGATVTEHTPPILWTFSGTQEAWRVKILDADDPTEILADSKKQDGADTGWTVPKKVLQDDKAYIADVRVWDGVDRVATPGDPIYTKATRDFTLDDDLAEAVPVLVSALQDGGTPFVVLTFTRTTAPDSWTIIRDGEAIDADVDPADTLVSGTTHTYTDPSAEPQVPHTYEVRSVVAGKSSQKSNAVSVTTRPIGGYLLNLDASTALQLLDFKVDMSEPDVAGVYRTISGQVVRVLAALGSPEGRAEGNMVEAAGHDLAAGEAFVRAVEKRGTCQLVWNDMSLEVRVGNVIVWTPPLDSRDRVKAVAFDFWAV